MGDRVRWSGAGESGCEWWPSQRADLPEVHTSQRQQNSGNAVVARRGSSAERTVCGTSFTHTIEGGGWAMRKFIAVIAAGMLVGGLLAGPRPTEAAPVPQFHALPSQGGLADPLTLAASGVLIPYFSDAGGDGTVALIEVASPVAANPDLHMLFYDTNCARVGGSVGIGETVNQISFFNPEDASSSTTVTSGLVAMAGSDPAAGTLLPLTAPIHSRVYEFTPTDGRSRVFEPIILDVAEFPGDPHTWSPLRTAATFFAPLETIGVGVHTELWLICPRTTIQGTAGAAFGTGGGPFSTTGFPVIAPPFQNPVSNHLFVRIYNHDEKLLRDNRVNCDCLTPKLSVQDIDPVYASPTEAPHGTYTEMEINFLPLEVGSNTNGTFTGYRGVFADGNNLNNFWGRLSNGNRLSIQGALTNAR